MLLPALVLGNPLLQMLLVPGRDKRILEHELPHLELSCLKLIDGLIHFRRQAKLSEKHNEASIKEVEES